MKSFNPSGMQEIPISKEVILAEAESMVRSNQDVLAGEPVFNGTRVPVRTIAAWLEADIPSEKIKESYPSVSDTMLRLAACRA